MKKEEEVRSEEKRCVWKVHAGTRDAPQACIYGSDDSPLLPTKFGTTQSSRKLHYPCRFVYLDY